MCIGSAPILVVNHHLTMWNDPFSSCGVIKACNDPPIRESSDVVRLHVSVHDSLGVAVVESLTGHEMSQVLTAVLGNSWHFSETGRNRNTLEISGISVRCVQAVFNLEHRLSTWSLGEAVYVNATGVLRFKGRISDNHAKGTAAVRIAMMVSICLDCLDSACLTGWALLETPNWKKKVILMAFVNSSSDRLNRC